MYTQMALIPVHYGVCTYINRRYRHLRLFSMEYVYRSDAWIDSARRSGPGPSGTTSTGTASSFAVVDEEVEERRRSRDERPREGGVDARDARDGGRARGRFIHSFIHSFIHRVGA